MSREQKPGGRKQNKLNGFGRGNPKNPNIQANLKDNEKNWQPF